jgi:hydroxymethylpyrimidine pyrophosphatase-like HAD family hydrolase
MIKIAFFDIDGVLTPTNIYTPNTSPKLTNDSKRILKEFSKKDFTLVFITARSLRELRLKNGFVNELKKEKLFEKSIIFGALGLDMDSSTYEFKTKNGKLIFRNGNAVLEKKPITKRETFSNLDQFLLYKMLIGKELNQQLKYHGIKLKPAISEEMINDARIYFELENNTEKERRRTVKILKKLVDDQKRFFEITKKFGTPTELIVRDIKTGISINPKQLGKHLGVLRALNKLKIKPSEKIIGYAFGDNKLDSEMKIRKDIKFIKVKNNKDFLKKSKKILQKN